MTTPQQPSTIEQPLAIYEPNRKLVSADDFMPLMTIEQAVQRKTLMNEFIKKILHESSDASDGDYGTIPGSTKKILKKPGAEKLCSIFGLAPQYTEDKIIEDWTGASHGGEPLFYYSYRCSLSRGGQFMGEAIGSCNTWESKYRYRWVREEDVPDTIAADQDEMDRLPTRGGTRKLFEPDFAIEKRETEGKYGKPAEYWERWADAIESKTAKRDEKKMGARLFQGYSMVVDEKQYRIPNPDVADVINTCQKMAQKRALVAAVLVVTNCSDAFTQDLDDFDPEPQGGATTMPTPTTDTPRAPAKGATTTQQSKAADEEPVPQELVKMFERIENDPTQFVNAVKLLEDGCVDRLGTVNGLKAYDQVADEFYARFPNGTSDVRELKTVLRKLHQIIETAPPRV